MPKLFQSFFFFFIFFVVIGSQSKLHVVELKIDPSLQCENEIKIATVEGNANIDWIPIDVMLTQFFTSTVNRESTFLNDPLLS